MDTKLVGLRTGEKRQEVTDITLPSPAGTLAFTRSYKQDNQGGPALMGSGWTHNHHLVLTLNTSTTPDTISVQTPNGGEAHFTYDSTAEGVDTYMADAGSSSIITYSSAAQKYTLTVSDKSTYEFDSTGNLVRRAWPQGVGYVWDYTYANSKLDKVEEFEKVGATLTSTRRKLVFRYHTVSPFAGLLYRVGDQTFDDSTPSQPPTGRYVEFGYTMGKQDQSGSIVDDTALEGYLLTSVRDVRGNLWLYDYYGQHTDETEAPKVNFLTRALALGTEDNFVSPTIVQEETAYTVSGSGSTATVDSLEHKRGMVGKALLTDGDMESASSPWAAIGSATTARSTERVFTGTYARKVEASAVDGGIQSTTWAMQANRTYMVTAWVYIDNGSMKMQVPDHSDFDRSLSVTDVWTLLRAVYTPTAPASSLHLRFVATSSPTTFYVDRVSVVEVVPTSAAVVTTLTFNDGASETTTEQVVGKTTIHRFNNGIYEGTEDPAGNTNAQSVNYQYRPETQLDANGNMTLLRWSTDGKRLEGVGDPLGHQVAFDYDTEDKLTSSTDAEGHQTAYSYDGTRQPTDVQVSDGTGVKRWQKFIYDVLGRTTLERTVDPDHHDDTTKDAQRVIRTYVPHGMTVENGIGLLQSITQEEINGANDVVTTYTYDEVGRVIKVQRQNVFGSCEHSYTVYDPAGNVVASICNYDLENCEYDPEDPESEQYFDAPTTAAEAVAMVKEGCPNKNQVTTYEYDSLGRRIKTMTSAGTSRPQTQLTFYDAVDRVVRTITNYVFQADSTPQDWYWNGTHWQRSSSDATAIQHGEANDQNLVTETAYNARGMVRKQMDVLGNVTLYGYDDAGRLVKTVQNASHPTYNNDYIGTSPDPSLDLESEAYPIDAAADKDIITVNTYDAVGNLVKVENKASGQVTFTVYDALNRPIKTVRNAKTAATIALLPNTSGYDASNDPRSEMYQVSGAAAPSSTMTPAARDAYEASGDPDRDQIERTEYDAMGRVIRARDAIGNWTLYGYDTLGRQVRVVRSAKTPTYDIAVDSDLDDYPIDPAADQDLMTETAYDPQGRVLYTEDKTTSQRTYMIYDGLGRQTKTIVNAVGRATDNGTSDPRSSSYIVSTEADEDLISSTTYDTSGRVRFTTDALGRKTWYVYDDLDRQVKVIQNCTYVSGNPAPEDPAYVGDHASDTSKDVISQTDYDEQGRVFKTIDARGIQTRYEYDSLGRRTKVITNYVDGEFNPAMPDEDLISTTSYDLAGRGVETTDPAGRKTYRVYDAAGRVILSVTNYVNPDEDETTPNDWYWNGTGWEYDSGNGPVLVEHGTANDQNLISVTTYDKLGRVVTSVDARRTQTRMEYDGSGRRLKVTQADGTPLAVTSYTCYDKAGRVLRTIQNYLPAEGDPSPDAKEASGNFLFVPTQHGVNEDENLITSYTLDKLGRQTVIKDAVDNTTLMSYRKDGQLLSTTDPEGTLTGYRYDKLRRRRLTVQSYVAGTFTDPDTWVWDDAVGQKRWEDGTGTTVTFGTSNDQNIIVAVTYDKGGRMLTLRDPRGNLTQYTYDLLDRRITLTNPLSQQWATAYSETSGTLNRRLARVVNTDPMSQQTQQEFDYLGHLKMIQYLNESPKLTPDVVFTYDAAGNRTLMTETNGSTVRETRFNYDLARRLSSVEFDNDGAGGYDETVAYEYDRGGLRTKLTLPGDLSVTYTYDTRGQLQLLTDWDSQATTYTYDNIARLRAVDRSNDLRSIYQYDPANRLRRLRHTKGNLTLSDFAYQVDKRGNRTEAIEYVRSASAGSTTILAPVDDFGGSNEVTFPAGTWTYNDPFRVTTDAAAQLHVPFGGDAITLTMGTGPDHAIYDVYIDGEFWKSIDGYAPSVPGEYAVSIPLLDEGPHFLDIYNRAEKRNDRSRSKVRFKSLTVNRQYTYYTWNYSYDALSRIKAANAYGVSEKFYSYGFDVAGNRTSQALGDGSTVDPTTYTYDAANRLTTSDHSSTITTYTYDAAGRLTNDGSSTYMWDRANRLLTFTPAFDGTSYEYNGLGQRVKQVRSGGFGSTTINYLLDTQPGLWQLLAETRTIFSESSGTTVENYRYVHGPTGLHAQKDAANNWEWMVQDGLGSIRGVVDNSANPLESRLYSPYGETIASTGTSQTPFGFAGEPTDGNGLIYLRARHYSPTLGQFVSLDPLELGNRYQYVKSNPIQLIDPSGLQTQQKTCEELITDMIESGVPLIEHDGELKPEVAKLLAQGVCSTIQVAKEKPSLIQAVGTNILASLASAPAWVFLGFGTVGFFALSKILYDAEQALYSNGQKQPSPSELAPIPGTEEQDDPPGQCDCNKLAIDLRNPAIIANPLLLYRAFRGINDMLCNLQCLGGQEEADALRKITATRPVEFRFMTSRTSNGYFVWPGYRITVDDTVQALGGRIAVQQPMNSFPEGTRADRLATLVEEIRHAAQYNNTVVIGQKTCSNISLIDAEIDAKKYKRDWVNKSAIPKEAFINWRTIQQPILSAMSHGRMTDNLRNRAFPEGTCPDEMTTVSCIDPLIIHAMSL